MGIKKYVHWNGKQFTGFVDFGIDLDLDANENNIPHAKKALVFMAVSITGPWKIPLGYFLVDKLMNSQLAIVEEGLRAGTKLTIREIQYRKQLMNVILAVQLLSDGVSKVLIFVKRVGTHFVNEDVNPTPEFLQNMNAVFDILNSR
ncbi:hypothetical protein CBL_20348 [Carabus blaptoides fortunei]